MINKMQEVKLSALDRIGTALADLEVLTNPFDIEAKVYFIMKLAEQSHKKLHALNSGVPHDCSHGVGPDVFEALFGKGGLGI